MWDGISAYLALINFFISPYDTENLLSVDHLLNSPSKSGMWSFGPQSLFSWTNLATVSLVTAIKLSIFSSIIFGRMIFGAILFRILYHSSPSLQYPNNKTSKGLDCATYTVVLKCHNKYWNEWISKQFPFPLPYKNGLMIITSSPPWWRCLA